MFFEKKLCTTFFTFMFVQCRLSFSHSAQVGPTLLQFATEVLPELSRVGEGKGGAGAYPTLTKRTYPVFYRALLQQLVVYVKTLPSAADVVGSTAARRMVSQFTFILYYFLLTC